MPNATQGAPAVSVIVRVHNEQRKLSRTLRSLLAQTLPGLEIVVVDEGSADRSYELALELQKQHPGRLRLHRQQSAGAAAAWNQGIALARGKYVGFAHVGGWAEPGMYAALHKACESRAADLCSAPYFGRAQRMAWDFAASHRTWERSECQQALLPQAVANYRALALWGKLIRRDFLLHSGLRISEEFPQGEETVFLARCLARCECLVTLARPFYHHTAKRQPSPSCPWAREQRLAQYTQLSALMRETEVDSDENRQLFCTGWMGALLEICVREYQFSQDEAAFYRKMITLAGEPQVAEALPRAARAALPSAQLQCYDAFMARDWAALRRLAKRLNFARKNFLLASHPALCYTI